MVRWRAPRFFHVATKARDPSILPAICVTQPIPKMLLKNGGRLPSFSIPEQKVTTPTVALADAEPLRKGA